jgi:hypothetical protein
MGALLRSGSQISAPVNAQQATLRDLMDWRAWEGMSTISEPPVNWAIWLQQASRADYLRNAGTAGFVDQRFYEGLNRYMDRHRAPAAARDVVTFRRGVASWNFAEAAAAGGRLMALMGADRSWIPGDELRDGLVLSRLHMRDARGARQALDSLSRFSTRSPTDLRSQLLTAYVETAERLQSVAAKP